MASRAARALILFSAVYSATAIPTAAQELLTLEQAQSRTGRDFVATYEGKVVRVRGQVSASPIWALGTYYLPIRDNTDHGLVLSGNLEIFADLAPGDVMEAEGKIESRGGLPLLIPLSIKKISSDPAPGAKELSLSELSGLRNLGLMVRTRATVERIGENTGGQILVVNDRAYPIIVFLPRPASDLSEHLASRLFKAREGDRVRILALATQYAAGPPYNRDFQLMLASPEDVEIIETAALLPPFLVFVVIVGLGLICLLWWLRERRLKAQRESWRAFYALSEDLIASPTPADMAEKLATVLPLVIDVTSASLFIFDRRTQLLNRVPTSIEPEPMVISLDDPPEGLGGAVVACFRSHTLLSLPDVRRNPLVKIGAKMNLPRSAMFVPLLSDNEILGVLEADNARSLGFFTPDEQASTQHLANQAAASLKLQEQRAMREQIFRSEKLAATGQLISGVAAELRSPLDNIAKLADSLSGLEDRPFSNADLNGLYSESRRAAEIVARLVSFATPGSDQTENIDLNGVLSGLIRFREPEWRVQGIRVQRRLAQTPAVVTGSRGQLEQLFLNLFVHAEQRAATAATKTLSIQSSLMGGQVHVEVGYSLDPSGESNPLDAAPPADGEALGLGVCLGIAKTHGGDIRFQSRGATAIFDVSLPLTDGIGKVSQEFEPSKPLRTLTLMIVDTDPDSQRHLLRSLGAKGHRAVPVNPQESVELMDRLHFDAVFWAIRSGGPPWSESHDRIRTGISAFVLLTEGYDPELARSLESTGGFLVSRPVQNVELDRVLREIEIRIGLQTR